MARKKKIKIRFTDEYFEEQGGSYYHILAPRDTVYWAYPPDDASPNFKTQTRPDKPGITWFVIPKHVVVLHKPTVFLSTQLEDK